MIGMLKGKIDISRYGMMIVDTGAIGYKVNVLSNIKLPEDSLGSEIKLYVHEHIREDQYELYGFLTYKELELFQILLSVSGVGPRAAQNIMMSAPSDRIFVAIESSDVSFFTSVSGIGKKVAAKIILELKSKISTEDSSSVLQSTDSSDDLVEALTSLGYKRHDINKMLSHLPAGLVKSEDKIKWLLKNTKG